MNDPSKRIDVNISSLLSLKAELLRKQEEVNKAKSKQSADSFIPKKSVKSDRDHNKNDNRNGKTNVNNQDDETNKNNVIEYEDSSLLDKSRKILEAKSRFYDKMIATGGNLNSDDNCLVLFNQKKQDDKPERKNSTDSSNSDVDDNGHESDDGYNDDDWVEYTDCLGRTRKCLKKDLEFFKKKDTQLAENIQPRIELNQNAPMWMIDTKGSNDSTSAIADITDDISEMTSVMSKHDQMKLNWEKKEEENIYKENVHYQDVLFDEARQHGVGYYAFSTDEEERAKQRKALDELREKTLTEQKQREAHRIQREKMIAERVKAAKNRQRARLGLPPLEDEPESTPEKLYDTKEEEKKNKKAEKERKKKEKLEKLLEEQRKNHIRPWDRNKEGILNTKRKHSSAAAADSDDENSDDDGNIEWKYKPEREPMSQEQWNEMKRNERNMNFAPVPEKVSPVVRSFRSQTDFSYNPDIDRTINNTRPETLYFTTKKPPPPPPLVAQLQSLLTTTKQTSNINNPIRNKEHRKEFIKRNYSSVSQDDDDDEKNRIPIRTELDYNEDYNNDDDDDDDDANKNMKASKYSIGAEIAPPPTYEYYGPSSGSKRSRPLPKPNLEQSIEAGLKFIRNQSDKGILPVKSSWMANTSNADY